MFSQILITFIFSKCILIYGGIVPSHQEAPNTKWHINTEYVKASDLDKGVGAGQPLNETDFSNGDKVDINARKGTDPIKDAIENTGEFEGDIKLNAEQAAIIANQTEDALIALRAASTVSYHKWPKSGSTARVPYVLSSSFSSSERANIARAISEFQSRTCIRIVPRTTESNYVSVYRGSGCSSYVGRQGGVQYLSLGTGCASSIGVIIHEFMHAIGYWHEQSRSDRDSYVIINWANIQSGQEHNFRKCASCTTQGHSYDVQSVMHYSNYAFSNGRGPTIQRRDCSTCSLGQRSGFSSLDVTGINTMYSCSDGGSTCVDNHQWCSYWAGQGYCTYYYVAWMRTNCRKSCRVC